MPWRMVVAVALAVVVPASLVEAGPIIGTYESIELGGTVLDGRWSESYAGGGPGQPGDSVHAASWDGSVLGGMWELTDPAIAAAPTVLLDTRVGGTGTVIYFTTYSGGVLYLTNTGPWWNAGDAGTEYVVDLTSYEHTTTNTYYNGVLVTSTTVVSTSGTFRDYPNYTLTFAVAVAVPLGEGSWPPSGYPDFVPDTATSGAWGIAQKIRTEIVPEPGTMAMLGIGLGAVLTSRRRRRR